MRYGSSLITLCFSMILTMYGQLNYAAIPVLAEQPDFTGPDTYIVTAAPEVTTPWYLAIPSDYIRPLNIYIDEERHFINLWFAGYWALSSRHNQFYHSNYDLTQGSAGITQHYLQFSYWGYGPEGHATISLFTLGKNRSFQHKFSVGFFNQNERDSYSASYGPSLELEDSVKRMIRGNELTDLDIIRADDIELLTYRKGLTLHYGELPNDLTTDLVRKEKLRSKSVKLSQPMFTKLLQLLNSEYITPSFEITDSEKLTKANLLFKNTLAAICELSNEIYCNGFSAAPQMTLDLNVNVRDPYSQRPTNEVYANTKSFMYERNSRQEDFIIMASASDVVLLDEEEGETKNAGLIVFASGRQWYLNKQFRQIAYYAGGIKNGVAHGRGEVIFGESSRVNVNSKRKHRLYGDFENGHLVGVGVEVNNNGFVIMSGEFQESLLNGRGAFFTAHGRPKFSATYLKGVITDGPLTEFRLGWEDYSPREVFKGEMIDGNKLGEWEPVIRVVKSKDGSKTLIDGDTIYHFPTDNSWWLTAGYQLHSNWRSSGKYIDPCEYHFSKGKLIGPCYVDNNTVAIRGTAEFFRADGKQFSTIVKNDGSFSYTELILVEEKKRDFFSRLGREFDRWGDDIERNFKELMCEIPETVDEIFGGETKCNVNAVGSADSDGNVWLGTDKNIARTYSYKYQNDTLPTDEEIRSWNSAMAIQDMTLDWDFLNKEGPEVIHSNFSPKKMQIQPFPVNHVMTPTYSGQIRVPGIGFGEYGRPRNRCRVSTSPCPANKKYKVYHTGTDYAAKPGEPILAPVTGEVVAVIKHEKFPKMNTIIIRSEHVLVKVLYTEAAVSLGDLVNQRDYIGTAADISANPNYRGVPNHTHMSIYSNDGGYTYSSNGQWRIQPNEPILY